MKLRLLITAGALALAGTLAATADIPGTFQRHTAQAKHGVALRQQQEQRQQQAARAAAAATAAVHAKVAVANPVNAVSAAEQTATVERLLSYKLTEKSGESTETTTRTYTYDQYGFPASIVSDTYRYDYAYTWVTPGKVWSKRVITETQSNGVTWVTTNERTFHSGGSVATIRETDYAGNITIHDYDANGYLIRTGGYDSNNPDSYSYTTYTYFPLTGEWFSGYENSSYKTIITVEDLSYTVESMEIVNGVWYTTNSSTTYYTPNGEQAGYLQISYNRTETGWEKSYASGYRQLVTATSVTNETWDDETGAWRVESATTYSDNFNNPWVYNAGETRTSAYASYNSDGTVSYTSTETYTWIAAAFVKCVATYGTPGSTGTSTYYYSVDADGNRSDAYYDEATGNYAISTYDDTYDYYSYYLADGTLSLELRSSYGDNHVEIYEQRINGVWTPCRSETIKLYDDGYDYTELTFDDQGRLTQEREVNLTTGVVNELTTYDYSDGVRSHSYDYSDYYVDGVANRYTSAESEEWTRADGSYSDYYLHFNYDGTVSYGYKYESSNYVSRNYNYSNGEWVLSYSSAIDTYESYTDEQGRTVVNYIYRSLDDNGNAYESEKGTRIQGEEGYYYEESYTWDADLAKWVGQSKYEYWTEMRPDFEAITPAEPTELLDEYFTPTGDSDIAYVGGYQCSKSYSWNAETGDWELANTWGEAFRVEGNTLYRTDIQSGETLETITVDAERRIIERIADDVTLSYTYDAEGRLTRKVEVHGWDNNSWTHDYTYGPVTISVSGIDQAAVAAVAAEVVATYTLSGIAVDAATAAPGIYVQRLADGTSRKLLLR